MKKQIILSLVIVFAMALFAPTVVKAISTDAQIEIVDGEEKKADEKKTEKKSDCKKSESKECSKKKSECCSAKKTDCSSKKACTDKK